MIPPLIEEYLPYIILISIYISKIRPNTYYHPLASSVPWHVGSIHQPCPEIGTVHVSAAPYSLVRLYTLVYILLNTAVDPIHC